jgi:signal transduction histidine kinase
VLDERARTLGAELHVEQADDGTTLRLVLPEYPRGEN